MIEAELPDGTILEFPDGTAPDVIQRAVKSRLSQPAPQATPSVGDLFNRELMNSVPVQALGGAIRGAGSIGATLMRPFETSAENQDRRADMTGALGSMGIDTGSIPFMGGKLGAEIAGTAGAGSLLAKAAVPVLGQAAPLVQALRSGGMTAGAGGIGTRMAGGAAAGGAQAAMIDPKDALAGAEIGAAIPLAGKLANAGGKLIGRLLRPSQGTIDVAQKAQQHGIPVGLGDVAENRMVQGARSFLNDAPITGGMARGAQETKQIAFNRAVGKTFGENEPKLTLDVLDRAKQRMGAEFDRIWNNNVLQVDPTLVNTMQSIKTQAQKLPKNEGASVIAEVDDFFGKMVPDQSGNLVVPGDVANKFQSYLRRRAESSAGLKNELGDLRGAIIKAFNQSVSPTDAAALTLTREQYKAFKTVEPILRSSELGVAGREAGNVPAALLPGAVNKGYGTLKNAPLADLSQVGSKFLVDRAPQTGGSARAALQNTAVGAALTGAGGWPALAAAVPVAYGAQKLMQSPEAAQMLMGIGQPPQTKALAEALRRALPLTAPALVAQ